MANFSYCLLIAFVSAFFHQCAEASGKGRNQDSASGNSRRNHTHGGHQAGGATSSSSVSSDRTETDEFSSSGSASAYASGVAGGTSGVYSFYEYGKPSSARPSYAPGAASSGLGGQVVMSGPATSFPKPQCCDQCNDRFRSELDLYEHKRVTHPVDAEAHCYLCNTTFTYRKNFMNHLKQRHPEVAAAETERQNLLAGDRYPCSVCRKRYNSAHGLRDHMKSHTTDDTTCHLCSKTYSTRAIFKRHMQDQHPEVEIPEPTTFDGVTEPETGPFECDQCGKIYNHRKNLRVHASTHKTLEAYCSACKQTFASRPSYISHMQRRHPEEDAKVHDEKRPVKCDRCDRRFKNIGSLRHHRLVHDGKTVCDKCGEKFRSRSALYNHKKKEHPK